MNFAEEMHALASDVRSRRKAEAKAKAEKIFESNKSSIEHFASLGQMSTSVGVPMEYKEKDRDAVAIALREVLIENGFKVSNIARDRYQISWAEVDEAF